MSPHDLDGRTFEQKIDEAAARVGVTLAEGEASAIRDRIQFSLLEGSPSDLSVAQLSDRVRQIVPAMRRAQATIKSHVALAGQEAPAAEHAGLFPHSLLRRFAEGGDPYQMRADAQEVVCSLVGDRRVRVNPANLVVTPLRVSEGE